MGEIQTQLSTGIRMDLYRKANVVDLVPQSHRFYEAFQKLRTIESVGSIQTKKPFKPLDSPEFQPALQEALETHKQTIGPDGRKYHYYDVTDLARVPLDETPENTKDAKVDAHGALTELSELGSLGVLPESQKVTAQDKKIFEQICKTLADQSDGLSGNKHDFSFELYKMGLAERMGTPMGVPIGKIVDDVVSSIVDLTGKPAKPRLGEKFILVVATAP